MNLSQPILAFSRLVRLLIAASLMMPFCSQPTWANVIVKSPSISLSFSAQGGLESIGLPKSASAPLVVQPCAGGFYLLQPDGNHIDLGVKRQPDADHIVAESADGAMQVVLSIQRASTHMALRIESLTGIPEGTPLKLRFVVNGAEGIRFVALDYMTEVRGTGVEWSYIGHRDASDPLGEFAIYGYASDADEDNTFLHIWAEDGVPHPKTGKTWTVDAARSWLAAWQKKFAVNRQTIIRPNSPQDLYAIMPYLEKAHINYIYMYPDSWRTAGFWPTDRPAWIVGSTAFPNGERDLRAFADYLHKRGMILGLQYVSGGIGPRDNVYIGSKPDRRLASWGAGKIAEAISATDKDVVFSPVGPITLHQEPSFFFDSYVRIDDEIVRADTITQRPDGSYLLANCQRGCFNTIAVPHPAGTDAAGLYSAYGQAFIPDNDSTLLAETAKAYANMINSCHVDHTEYDGFEIHCYNGDWGAQKYASLVYSALDRPVTVGTSGGRPPDCYFEYKFHSSQSFENAYTAKWSGNASCKAPLETASIRREASNLLDVQFMMNHGCDPRIMSLLKPEPMFGISLEDLKEYGQTDQTLQLVADWEDAAGQMTPDQVQTILSGFKTTPLPFRGDVHHPETDTVWCLERNGKGDGYLCVPTHVMCRKEGDIVWHTGQEFGAIEPKQYVKPGQTLDLINPDAAQEPSFIVRVLWALNPSAQTTTAAATSGAVTLVKPQDLFAPGQVANQAPATGPLDNIDVQPTADEMSHVEGLAVQREAPGAVRVTGGNPSGTEVWHTNKSYASWNRSVDMRGRRAIGMNVTGDGSGATLVIQIAGCDYVVPIDFTGARWVEIPNGQVAWADGHWGWRMETKRCDYEHVNWFRIGFGYLPTKSHSSIVISSMTVLGEIASKITDPVIRVGGGSLTVHGSVATNQYLQYEGGDNATVYDENWNIIADLPVTKNAFVAPSGSAPVSITTDGTAPAPWLETQFFTHGTPMIIPAVHSH